MRHPSEAQAFVEFHAVPASVRTGLWCTACALPSACSVLIVAIAVTPWQLRILTRSRAWTCDECGRTCSIPEAVRPPG